MSDSKQRYPPVLSQELSPNNLSKPLFLGVRNQLFCDITNEIVCTNLPHTNARLSTLLSTTCLRFIYWQESAICSATIC